MAARVGITPFNLEWHQVTDMGIPERDVEIKEFLAVGYYAL